MAYTNAVAVALADAFPDDAVELCVHNRAHLVAAAAYQRLARSLATFPGCQGIGTTDCPSAGAS